jgi:hypothetical protein
MVMKASAFQQLCAVNKHRSGNDNRKTGRDLCMIQEVGCFPTLRNRNFALQVFQMEDFTFFLIPFFFPSVQLHAANGVKLLEA